MAGGRLVSLDRLLFFFEDGLQHDCFLHLGTMQDMEWPCLLQLRAES